MASGQGFGSLSKESSRKAAEQFARKRYSVFLKALASQPGYNVLLCSPKSGKIHIIDYSAPGLEVCPICRFLGPEIDLSKFS